MEWSWSANVRAKDSELDRSFSVLIFLGSVPEDPREWISTPSYAGEFCTFVTGGQLVRSDVVSEGCVDLNCLLVKNERMRTFDPLEVRPHLKNQFDWRTQMADGTPVPLERLPSLEVVVVAAQYAMRPGELPESVSELILHRDLTSGRLGGAGPE